MPEDLVVGLKARAAEAHRSLSGEILFRLRKSLESEEDEAKQAGLRGAEQAAAWEKLSGTWVSDLSVDEEIDALYSERSEGRVIDLRW